MTAGQAGAPAPAPGMAAVFRMVDELDATEARRALRLLAQDRPAEVAAAVQMATQLSLW